MEPSETHWTDCRRLNDCFFLATFSFLPSSRAHAADPGPTQRSGRAGNMPVIEELSPDAGPVSIRPLEDEIDDDEDEDVSG